VIGDAEPVVGTVLNGEFTSVALVYVYQFMYKYLRDIF
jgi:hypothetical protein